MADSQQGAPQRRSRRRRRPQGERGGRWRHVYPIKSSSEGQLVARWKDPVGGRWRQKSLGGLTKGQADDWFDAKDTELTKEHERLAGAVLGDEGTSPSAVVEVYLKWLASEGRLATNRQAPLRRMAAMLEEYGVATTLAVNKPMMTRVRDWFAKSSQPSGKPYTPRTRQFFIDCASAFWGWARERGYAAVSKDDVMDSHKGIKIPHELVTVFQPDEVRMILDVCIAYDQRGGYRRRAAAPFVLALILTGCRSVELRELEWGSVQLEGGWIVVRAGSAKNSRARRVMLAESPTMVPLLKALRRLRGQSNGPFGHSKQSLARMVGELRRFTVDDQGNPLRLPEGFVLKTCRATCASALATSTAVGLTATALRDGHDEAVLKASYLGLLVGTDRNAPTVEKILGIEDHARRVIELLEAK